MPQEVKVPNVPSANLRYLPLKNVTCKKASYNKTNHQYDVDFIHIISHTPSFGNSRKKDSHKGSNPKAFL